MFLNKVFGKQDFAIGKSSN